MSEPTRFVLAVAAPLVPRDRRAAWRRQWTAEIAHRSASGQSVGTVLLFTLGAFRHAVFLRREQLRMTGWWGDLRFASRSLLRRPGFSALVIVTLGIGIGSATAVFSLTEALLLRPLPMESSERLVRIYSTDVSRGFGWFSVSYPDYVDFTERLDLFEVGSFFTVRQHDVSGDGEPERVRAAAVHADFFQLLATPAELGRPFQPDDHDPASDPTVVLAESFWTSRFGADSTLIGRTLRVDGVQHTVIGVVPDRLAWPRGIDLWTPLQWGGSVPEYAAARSNHSWQVLARLQPEVDADEASDQIEAMARTIYARREIDERDRGLGAVVVPLRFSEAGDDAGQLFGTLAAAVFMVLLIASMNASALLLTRAWGRARELSVRTALGAGRSRLVATLLGETVLLALCGGVLGVVVGHLALERAFAMVPGELTNSGDLRLNGAVVSAGLAISLLAALFAGLGPALRATRVSTADTLRDGSAQSGHGSRTTRVRRTIVVAELALSLALLVGAGVAVRGFQRQIAADPGFDASSLLSFTVRLPATRYGETALVDAYYREAVTRLEARPEIEAATSLSRLPLGGGGMSLRRAFVFEGATPPPEGPEYPASWIEVDSDFIGALDVRMVEGRSFTVDDGAEAPLVAVVNESMARRMSPDESIVGRVIRSHYDENLPRTVVGVVPDIQFGGVSREAAVPLVLVPRDQSPRSAMAFLVRVRGEPEAAVQTVRSTMGELDADVALDELQPLRDAHASDLAGIRFLTTLFGSFGLLALLLAVSGVYGMVSYSVSQRRQEIGVRMAMGASGASVRGTVILESARFAGLGLLIGAGLAFVVARVVAAGMDGIAATDGGTILGVVLLLTGAVLAASWIPASRATRVDPVEALRSE